MEDRNFSLFSDFYEFTMTAGYFARNIHNQIAIFDLFVRRLPPKRDYIIATGLPQVIEFCQNFHIEPHEIDYILSNLAFEHYPKKSEFKEYLSNLHFDGIIQAVPEGTLMFAEEPLLKIIAPLGIAQLLETALIAIIGHQTIIATKATYVVQSAKDKPVIDFGARRAHGIQAGYYGSRACYIGGCVSTSNVIAGMNFGIPTTGTQAHSWIQSYTTEYDAFQGYSTLFPDSTILLIDTYDVIEGTRNAARLNASLKIQNKHPILGVRIDSGDLLANSRAVRHILDEEGQKEMKIFVSSDLNEDKIHFLMNNNAPIDAFGVGTEMMISKDEPALDIVYKLVQLDGKPKIKLSEGKHINPGNKQIFREIHDGIYFDSLGFEFESYSNAIPLLSNIEITNSTPNLFPDLSKIRTSVRLATSQFRGRTPLKISAQLSDLTEKCFKQYLNTTNPHTSNP